MNRPLMLVSAVALYNSNGEILLAQRPAGKSMAGLWEFPGGKVEPGETPEAALIRELTEELGITVNESSLKPITFASHAYPEFHLLMPIFQCKEWVGHIRACEGQVLAWVAPGKLNEYPAPAADIPLFAMLAGR